MLAFLFSPADIAMGPISDNEKNAIQNDDKSGSMAVLH